MEGGAHSSAAGYALKLANNMPAFNKYVPTLLNTVDAFHGLLGPRVLEAVSFKLNSLSSNVIPTWNKFMPRGAAPLRPVPKAPANATNKVRNNTPSNKGEVALKTLLSEIKIL
eukprot:7684707-Pyramimonas_sp.AAC.1